VRLKSLVEREFKVLEDRQLTRETVLRSGAELWRASA
jgi:hypothetical protein